MGQTMPQRNLDTTREDTGEADATLQSTEGRRPRTSDDNEGEVKVTAEAWNQGLKQAPSSCLLTGKNRRQSNLAAGCSTGFWSSEWGTGIQLRHAVGHGACDGLFPVCGLMVCHDGACGIQDKKPPYRILRILDIAGCTARCWPEGGDEKDSA